MACKNCHDLVKALETAKQRHASLERAYRDECMNLERRILRLEEQLSDAQTELAKETTALIRKPRKRV